MPGRILAHVVAAVGANEKQVLTILRQLEPDGLAEVDWDGWRLTAEAEQLYGRAG